MSGRHKIFIYNILMLMFCFSVEIAYADFLPLPWTYGNADEYEAGITSTDSFQGSFSAYLRSGPDKNAAEKGTLRQMQFLPRNWLGKKIKLTVYIKAISVENGAGAYMKVYSGSGEIISDLMEDRPVRGDSDWKQYTIILDVTYDATMFHFGVWLEGRGEIRVDNFEFGIADPDEKITGKSEKRKYGEPENLDFESGSDNFLPKPWKYLNADEYEAGIISADSFHGSSSAYLRSRPDKKGMGKGSLAQMIRLPKDWFGKKMKLTVSMKSICVEKSAGAYMRIVSDRGETISDWMEDRPVRGNSDWKRYTIILDIPYDAATTDFGVWLKGKGEVRVDNFEFGTAHPKEKGTGKSEKRKYGKPDNLDFESKSEGSIPIR